MTVKEILDNGQDDWTGPEKTTLAYTSMTPGFTSQTILPHPVQMALRSAAQ